MAASILFALLTSVKWLSPLVILVLGRVPSRVILESAPIEDASMKWLPWALLSAAFAGLTAILAKVGVKGVDTNLATAIRTTVILAFAWLIAGFTNEQPLRSLTPR